MAPSNLTPEQQAEIASKRAAREAKRAAIAAGLIEPTEQNDAERERSRVLQRDWISNKAYKSGREGDGEAGKGVKIISWNILAQTLIRRDLFPGSDALRWGDRKAMLERELGHYSRIADIVCLQECDRLRDLIHCMSFDKCVQARGHGKQHGLVIAYRSERFGFRGSRIVHLDEEELSPSEQDRLGATSGQANGDANGQREGSENDSAGEVAEKRRRRGGTRQTKNVGLIVGLENREREGKGIIVATAHLFWHPIYQYERVRQFIVLIRAIKAFQAENKLESWPVVMAGDFNASPCEAPYQLLVNPSSPLPTEPSKRLDESRIVHTSVDKVGLAQIPRSDRPVDRSTNEAGMTSTSGTGTNTPTANTTDHQPVEKDDEGEGEGELPDSNEKSTAKTRAPEPSDGIREVEELQKMMADLVGPGLKSAYDIADWKGEGDDTFTSRGGWPESPEKKGGGEPGYTCYTALFKLTLDYLFILEPASSYTGEGGLQVRQVLRPAKKEELGEGLPMKGIGASDHLAVGCDLMW